MNNIPNFLLYSVVYGSTVFINKYVLTVLGFTYPTIYQGWQTLVGGILLRLLLYRTDILSMSPTPMDRSGFVSLFPSFLFFAGSLVASSKALANMTVGMFLCLQNTLSSVLFLLNAFPNNKKDDSIYTQVSSKPRSNSLSLCGAVCVILSASSAVIADLDRTFGDSPYFWMLISLLCVAAQKLHSKIADARYTDVDRLYFSYIFSVVLLAPASLYLEEAFAVLKFPHASRLDFMAACIVVGVLALAYNIQLIKVQYCQGFTVADAVSKLVAACISLVIFKDSTTNLVKGLQFLNLGVGLLVPQDLPAAHPMLPEDLESASKLIVESS